ncbi:MAG: PDZ domain-containing protein [Caldilineaceae bacterium]|nr:PDZ domain-containing protein [Caldilineaceae bacterium]
MDEGGPVLLTGKVTYTNPFFTVGVAAPLIILEDQAGFIDRDPSFVIAPSSQTLGQITSDFLKSPFTYSLALPIEPQGARRDVDQDGTEDPGVMVFAVAYWTNKFGDPFLEKRDLFGGGWSTAYASTRVTEEVSRRDEVTGGKLLVYAPAAYQGFPNDFGPDGLLFTADDPISTLAPGYTVVNLDTRPFTFDRSRHPTVDLIEPDFAALDDFSRLSYTAAFDAMLEKLRHAYAFTTYKGIDWDALAAEFRPLIAAAEAATDRTAYLHALRDFSFAIPDGHVQGPLLAAETNRLTTGGIGLTLAELDDGSIIAVHLTPAAPAANAGILLGDTILAINDQSIGEYVSRVIPWNGPFSTDHAHRLQQLRYATRFPVGTPLTVTYTHQGSTAPINTALVAIAERDSFNYLEPPRSGYELPVEVRPLESGYTYVQVNSFFDNDLLTIQLWERLLSALNRQRSPGVIIDLRNNGGGSGFLADQMAAYFFNSPLELGNSGRYNPESGDFYFDPRTVERFYLPPAALRYDGPLVVIVGPACSSACEFFAYDLSLQGRATIVGHYPSAGLGGSIAQLLLPEQVAFQYTSGRAVDMHGNIHIEGIGVVPTLRVPVTAETLFAKDALLEAAVAHLDSLK